MLSCLRCDWETQMHHGQSKPLSAPFRLMGRHMPMHTRDSLRNLNLDFPAKLVLDPGLRQLRLEDHLPNRRTA